MNKKQEPPTKKESSTTKKENTQLAWFFFWIILAFALFLGTYFFIQETKTFDYAHINWAIEKYDTLTIYHGRFLTLNGENVTYNIYLRVDPRNNDVPTIGNFSSFKIGSYISLSPSVEECRGEVSRTIGDLGSFTKRGIGTMKVDVATTDTQTSIDLSRPYITCENTKDRTVIVITKGGTSTVTQSEINPYCYTISLKDCEDKAPLEKFMVTLVDDFRTTYPL